MLTSRSNTLTLTIQTSITGTSIDDSSVRLGLAQYLARVLPPLLVVSIEQKGMLEQALAEYEKAVDLSERGTNAITSLGRAYAVTGKKHEARKIIEELEIRAKQRNISAYQMALIHLGLDEKDQALGALEKAFQERSTLLTYLSMDPRFDPLRTDPRFRDLLRRMKFPE